MRNYLWILTSILLVFSSLSFAEVYKWKDDKGDVHYSETPPSKSSANYENMGYGDGGKGKKIDTNFILDSQLNKLLSLSKELKKTARNCYDAASRTKIRNQFCMEYSNRMSNNNLIKSLDAMSRANLNKKQSYIWQDISNNLRDAESYWNKAEKLFPN